MLHDTTRRPRTLLDLTQGLPVLTKVPHQRSKLLQPCRYTPHSSLTVCCYFLKGIPHIRIRIYETPRQAHNIKANKTSNWKQEWANPKVHLTYNQSPAESPVLWLVGTRTDCFWNAGSRLRLFLQNVAVSKSRYRLLFYATRKGQKHRKIPFWDISRGREVDL